MSVEREAHFWRQAQDATARADKARSDELCRAWLIVARDWAEMAREEEAKTALERLAYVSQHLPTAPNLTEPHHTDATRR